MGARSILSNRLVIVGGLLVLCVVLASAGAPLLSYVKPTDANLDDRFAWVSWTHLLGTDQLGRDAFTRILYGGRVSLLVSASAVVSATLLGGSIGVVAGYIGGWFDTLLMRISDVFLAIPTLLLALGVVALIGPSGPAVAMALSVAFSPTFARVMRGAVVNIRSNSYIEASQVMGASPPRIIVSDVLPNVFPILVVQITTALAWGILAEANIGFLGLGVQPPNPSWGAMLIEGRTYFYQAPWIPLFAGVAVLIAVFGFNLLGDGLRDLLDPRSRQGEA